MGNYYLNLLFYKDVFYIKAIDLIWHPMLIPITSNFFSCYNIYKISVKINCTKHK